MRTFHLPMFAAVAGFLLVVTSAAPQQPVAAPPPSASNSEPSTPAQIAAAVEASVANYRKIIVLMDDATALDEGNRERVRTAAWILFEKNRDRLDQLEESLRADAARNNSPLVAAFLDRLMHHSHLAEIRGKSYRLHQHSLTARGRKATASA